MSQPEKPDAFLEIDADNLDLNCFGQPKLIRYWSRQLALASRKAADAKNNVKLVWAELRNRIRENPMAFNLVKVSVDIVDDTTTASPEYQDALKALTTAEYEESLLKSNVEALKSRDYQLTNAGELLKLGYFSAPRVDASTRQRYQEAKRTNLNDVAAALAGQDSKPTPKATKPAKK